MRTSESEVALQTRDLTAGYRGVTVVRGVSMAVRRGEFVALLGANGVGKTTLLRAIVGSARVTSGDVMVGAQAVNGRRTHLIARMGIALVPEGRALVPDSTVRDNLALGTACWSRRFRSADMDRALDEVFQQFPILGQRSNQLAGSLSGGEQQMLAIGRALVARPEVLVLDEPSLGLAPKLVRQVFDALAAVNARGITVLVAEQNATVALGVAGRAYVMSGGRIVLEGPAKEIQQSHELRTAFLGHEKEKQ